MTSRHAGSTVHVHQTRLALNPDGPIEVFAGAVVHLKVRVSCVSGCDLAGASITCVDGDQTALSVPMVTDDGASTETAGLELCMPPEVCSHAWRIVFERQSNAGIVHEESSRVFVVRTRPHETSMAVWGQPAPVVMNDGFRVNVGVKCDLGCELANHRVHIVDESGVMVGEGRFGDTPWPGTESLYVAAVPLRAPPCEGIISWSAIFEAIDLPLPHHPVSARLGFRTVRAPDHIVTVRVIDRETEAPVGDAQVHVGGYLGSTNEEGLVNLALPKAAYEIKVRKAGYECLTTPLEVVDDIVVPVVVSPVPDNPDDELWM